MIRPNIRERLKFIYDKAFSTTRHLKAHVRIYTQEKPFKYDVVRRHLGGLYNDRTVTHLHIKWGVAVGPIVVGAGTRHLPPSRIHAPVTNPRWGRRTRQLFSGRGGCPGSKC